MKALQREMLVAVAHLEVRGESTGLEIYRHMGENCIEGRWAKFWWTVASSYKLLRDLEALGLISSKPEPGGQSRGFRAQLRYHVSTSGWEKVRWE